MRAAAEADEPEEANREAIIGGEFASPKSQSRTYQVSIRDLFFLISTQYLLDFNQLAQNTQGEKAMQAAAKADEPDKAMRKAARPASLVHNTMINSFDLKSIFNRF